MKKTLPLIPVLCSAFCLSAWAAIERVDEGGQELDLSRVVPHGESGIIVFYASWDAPSTTLVDHVESWSTKYVGLNLVFVDVTDLRTPVCRQFGIKELPAIVVVDDDHDPVGEIMDNVYDLEEFLSDEGMI